METANLQILCILQMCRIKAEDNKRWFVCNTRYGTSLDSDTERL